MRWHFLKFSRSLETSHLSLKYYIMRLLSWVIFFCLALFASAAPLKVLVAVDAKASLPCHDNVPNYVKTDRTALISRFEKRMNAGFRDFLNFLMRVSGIPDPEYDPIVEERARKHEELRLAKERADKKKFDDEEKLWQAEEDAYNAKQKELKQKAEEDKKGHKLASGKTKAVKKPKDEKPREGKRADNEDGKPAADEANATERHDAPEEPHVPEEHDEPEQSQSSEQYQTQELLQATDYLQATEALGVPTAPEAPEQPQVPEQPQFPEQNQAPEQDKAPELKPPHVMAATVMEKPPSEERGTPSTREKVKDDVLNPTQAGFWKMWGEAFKKQYGGPIIRLIALIKKLKAKVHHNKLHKLYLLHTQGSKANPKHLDGKHHHDKKPHDKHAKRHAGFLHSILVGSHPPRSASADGKHSNRKGHRLTTRADPKPPHPIEPRNLEVSIDIDLHSTAHRQFMVPSLPWLLGKLNKTALDNALSHWNNDAAKSKVMRLTDELDKLEQAAAQLSHHHPGFFDAVRQSTIDEIKDGNLTLNTSTSRSTGIHPDNDMFHHQSWGNVSQVAQQISGREDVAISNHLNALVEKVKGLTSTFSSLLPAELLEASSEMSELLGRPEAIGSISEIENAIMVGLIAEQMKQLTARILRLTGEQVLNVTVQINQQLSTVSKIRSSSPSKELLAVVDATAAELQSVEQVLTSLQPGQIEQISKEMINQVDRMTEIVRYMPQSEPQQAIQQITETMSQLPDILDILPFETLKVIVTSIAYSIKQLNGPSGASNALKGLEAAIRALERQTLEEMEDLVKIVHDLEQEPKPRNKRSNSLVDMLEQTVEDVIAELPKLPPGPIESVLRQITTDTAKEIQRGQKPLKFPEEVIEEALDKLIRRAINHKMTLPASLELDQKALRKFRQDMIHIVDSIRHLSERLSNSSMTIDNVLHELPADSPLREPINRVAGHKSSRQQAAVSLAIIANSVDDQLKHHYHREAHTDGDEMKLSDADKPHKRSTPEETKADLHNDDLARVNTQRENPYLNRIYTEPHAWFGEENEAQTDDARKYNNAAEGRPIDSRAAAADVAGWKRAAKFSETMPSDEHIQQFAKWLIRHHADKVEEVLEILFKEAAISCYRRGTTVTMDACLASVVKPKWPWVIE